MALDIYADVGERIKKAVEGALTDALNEALPPRGTPISQSQAATKYGVSRGAIQGWVKKNWVSVLHPGKGRTGSTVLIDERDIAEIVLTNDISKGHRTQAPNSHSLLEIARDVIEAETQPRYGFPITVQQAATKYSVSRQTIYDWAKKGRIKTFQEGTRPAGRRVLVDEADVARIVQTEGVGRSKTIRQAEQPML